MTAYQIIVRPEAVGDLAGAYWWYEEQRTGLGEEFLGSVEARIASISQRPESFRRVGRTMRRALVRRFPYGVFFDLDRAQHAVIVKAILHVSRNPRLWRRRQ